MFELSIARDGLSRTWDVTADGQRILAVYVPEEAKPRRIEIMTGFFGELELAPGR